MEEIKETLDELKQNNRAIWLGEGENDFSLGLRWFAMATCYVINLCNALWIGDVRRAILARLEFRHWILAFIIKLLLYPWLASICYIPAVVTIVITFFISMFVYCITWPFYVGYMLAFGRNLFSKKHVI